MPTKIPLVPSQGYYDFTTTVNNLTLTLTVRWNQRDNAFYMDIDDQSGADVATGIKLVLGAYLGRASQHQLFQDGVLVLIDTSGKLIDAGFDEMGDRLELWYYTANELITNALTFGATAT